MNVSHWSSSARIPRPAQKTKYEDVTEIAVVVRRLGKVLLRQCQPGERWAGLWDFLRFAPREGQPLAEQIAEAARRLARIEVTAGQQLATLRHGVTRFRITLHCYEAASHGDSRTLANGSTARIRWVHPVNLAEYPLSTTGRKISRLL